MERFFDESGGMQLVLHSPFGSRINRAWGLALRKRFCRSFNFELQAAATDDAIVISLGTQHSFPLDEVFRYLNSKTVRDLLVQALLDAPMFTIRWRWNATRSLAVPRFRGGAKIAAPLQRMESENLLAAVFPDQLACLEHIVGDREIPDHPLVKQTIDDCLTEAMDIAGLEEVLRKIERGEIRCIARDLPEPSPLAAEIFNARPYAFLDNAPLEERRTQAVYTRRASDRNSSDGLGVLDAAAIEKVKTEAWPEATNADELHDALMLVTLMTPGEIYRSAGDENADEFISTLLAENRATRVLVTTQHSNDREVLDCDAAAPLSNGEGHRGACALSCSRGTGHTKAFYIAAERIPMLRAIFPDALGKAGINVARVHARKNLGTRRRDSRVGSRTNGSLRTNYGQRVDRYTGFATRGNRRRAARARGRRLCSAREISSAGNRARMVRPSAAGANSSAHDRPLACGNSAGLGSRFLSFSLRVAASRPRTSR